MTDQPANNRGTRALALVALVSIALGAGFIAGRFSGPAPDDDTPSATPPAPAGSEDQAQQQEALQALGYSSGTVKAPENSGVVTYDAPAARNGYNLYTSADAPKAYLMKMDGEIVHEWEYAFEKLWPNVDPGEENVGYWRRAHLFDNGDILAIIEPHGIFRVDKDSNLLWENHCGAHHDLYVAPNGHIFVLVRKKRMVDWDGKPRPILEDAVLELDENGKELRRVSVYDALLHTPYAPLLLDAPSHWDITHTNALKYIAHEVAGGVPAFQPGHFLVSLRELDTVAVLDFDAEKIEWALKGQWRRQHEPTLLDSGHILLFDNLGNGGKSKVIEFDPATQQIAWSYGTLDDELLDSPVCGLAARLPNGNTLITEAVPGRVIEVTPDHRIVWEYRNPHRPEKTPDIVATIMHFERLPETFAPDWLGDGNGT